MYSITTMFSYVYTLKDISSSKEEVIDDLNVLSNLIALEQNKNSLQILTDLQIFLKKKYTNPESQIKNIIIHHGLMAEKFAPKAFETYLQILTKILKNQVILEQEQNFTFRTIPSTINDIEYFTKSYFSKCKNIQKIFIEALTLAGYSGKILIEKSSSDIISLELTNGFTFEHQPLWAHNLKFNNPRVLCIDGYIESVSEIHFLLESFSNTKETLLLFVRGMSEDVKHTLKVNYDRKSLQIIPIIVKFDLEGINALNDICVVTNCDLKSSTKGDLISSISIDSSVTIENCSIFQNKIILNSKVSNSLQTHIKYLIEKRDIEKIPDVIDLLSNRIKSLTPSHVVIRLPNDKNYILSAQAIDYALRMTKILLERGIIVLNEQRIPATTYIVASKYAHNCARILANIGAIIVNK